MRGRKPIPSNIKRANGNPGKRPLDVNEPVYTVPEQVPYAPRGLDKAAQCKWRQLAPFMMKVRVLTEADFLALELLCHSYGRWIEARKKVAEEGAVLTGDKGGQYQNPWVFQENKAHEQILKLCSEFGMTPSSRTRVSIVDGSRQLSLAELLFESATGQDVAIGDEEPDGVEVEGESQAAD